MVAAAVGNFVACVSVRAVGTAAVRMVHVAEKFVAAVAVDENSGLPSVAAAAAEAVLLRDFGFQEQDWDPESHAVKVRVKNSFCLKQPLLTFVWLEMRQNPLWMSLVWPQLTMMALTQLGEGIMVQDLMQEALKLQRTSEMVNLCVEPLVVIVTVVAAEFVCFAPSP